MRLTVFASSTISALALMVASASAQTQAPSAGGAGESGAKPSIGQTAPRQTPSVGAPAGRRDMGAAKGKSSTKSSTEGVDNSAARRGAPKTEAQGEASPDGKAASRTERTRQHANEPSRDKAERDSKASPPSARDQAAPRRGASGQADRDRADDGKPAMRGQAAPPRETPSAETRPGADQTGRSRAERQDTPVAPSARDQGETRQPFATPRSGSETAAQTRSRGAGSVQTGSVTLDRRQARVVRNMLQRRNVQTFSRSDFFVGIGARLPNHVRLYPLPSAFVSIVPQYAGYDYVVVDDEIVVVAPESREVVATFNEGGGAIVAEEDSVSSEDRGPRGSIDRRAMDRNAQRFSLNRDQQRTVYQTVMRDIVGNERETCTLRIGERVPQAITLTPLSVPGVPGAERYSYFVVSRQVVLVDPQTREVVEILGGETAG
jgi:hypothetical protein